MIKDFHMQSSKAIQYLCVWARAKFKVTFRKSHKGSEQHEQKG